MPEEKHNKHYRPSPLDFTLLELMPDKGMIGGIHWKGRRAKDLREEILDNANGELTPDMLKTSEIQSRLRSMHVEGLIENFVGRTGTDGKLIWAVTEKGRAFAARKEEVLGT